LAVHNVVACRDVGEARVTVAWRVDHVGHCLSAKPVAVVVTDSR
jgi:hypothetical protein